MKRTNKKLLLTLSIGILSLAPIMMVSATSTPNAYAAATSNEKIKLVNDTDEKLKVHTGTGSVSLNPGGSTSISCDAGKVIKVNGKEVFKVTEEMCGKTIKLSKYL